MHAESDEYVVVGAENIGNSEGDMYTENVVGFAINTVAELLLCSLPGE